MIKPTRKLEAVAGKVLPTLFWRSSVKVIH